MADEDVLQEEKKGGMLKWIIILVVLIALGVGGYFGYTMFSQHLTKTLRPRKWLPRARKRLWSLWRVRWFRCRVPGQSGRPSGTALSEARP